MTTARKATPSEDPLECGGTSPLGKPVKMAVMSLQYSIEGVSSCTQEGCTKKFSGQKNFWVKKIFGSKILWVKKIFCPKNWGQKNFVVKKIFV